MALTPGNNIIDNQNSLENTAVGTSSQTPFVMGRRIARNSILNRMDCRSVGVVCVCMCVCVCVRACVWYLQVLSQKSAKTVTKSQSQGKTCFR